MGSEQTVTQWIDELKASDPVAAQRIWERYFSRLVQLARQKLQSLPRRAADEEDVALSAFQSFWNGVAKGRFPQLHDRNDLWQILVTLVGWKASDLRKHERAAKRGGGQVRGDSAFRAGTAASSPDLGIAQVVDSGPTPEFVALIAEESERLLEQLGDDTLREVALLKMEGYTNEEIAERLGCVVRTVERKLQGIRIIWMPEKPA